MAQKFEYNVNKSTWSMTHLLLEPGIPGIFKVTRYASGKLNFACKLDYIPLCNVQEHFFSFTMQFTIQDPYILFVFVTNK